MMMFFCFDHHAAGQKTILVTHLYSSWTFLSELSFQCLPQRIAEPAQTEVEILHKKEKSKKVKKMFEKKKVFEKKVSSF